MVEMEKIKKAVLILIKSAVPERIILFGSYARGDQCADSDVDLLIVKKNVKNKYKEMIRLRRELSPLRIPVEIVLSSENTLSEWEHVPGSLYFNVLKEGKVLYEKT